MKVKGCYFLLLPEGVRLASESRASGLQSLAASPDVARQGRSPEEAGKQHSPANFSESADDTLSLLTELHREVYSREAKPGQAGQPLQSSQQPVFGLLQALRRESSSQSAWLSPGAVSDQKAQLLPGSTSTRPSLSPSLQAPLSPSPLPAQQLTPQPNCAELEAASNNLLVSFSEKQQEQHQELMQQQEQLLSSLHLQEEQIQLLQEQQRSMIQEMQTAHQQISAKQHSELQGVQESLRLILSGQQEVQQDISRLHQQTQQAQQARIQASEPGLLTTLTDSRPAPTAPTVPTAPEVARVARPSEPSQVSHLESPLAESLAHRRWLTGQVFRCLDHDGDGRLAQTELKGLATLMGFDGRDSEWIQEYQQLCADSHTDERKGFDLEGFAALLENPKGCPSTTDSLFRALLDLQCAGNEDRERASLVISLFEVLDRDRDGFVGVQELRVLAVATGFRGSEDEWISEYRLLCEDLPKTSVLLRKGLDLQTFGRLLADSSGSGLYCSIPQLQSFIAHFSDSDAKPKLEASIPGARDALSRSRAGPEPRRPKPMASELPALKRHSIGAKPGPSALPPPAAYADRLEDLGQPAPALRRATVHGETGIVANSSHEPSKASLESQDLKSADVASANPKSRSRLIRTIFQLLDANSDGILDSEEMHVLASVASTQTNQHCPVSSSSGSFPKQGDPQYTPKYFGSFFLEPPRRYP